jgi:hypothetical protein
MSQAKVVVFYNNKMRPQEAFLVSTHSSELMMRALLAFNPKAEYRVFTEELGAELFQNLDAFRNRTSQRG